MLVGTITALSMFVNVRQEEMSHLTSHIDQITPHPIGLVLGASTKLDGTPSDVLYDRVSVGIALYKQGKVSKLLMTGDDGKFHTNEIAAMTKIALDQGVPMQDILTDGQGYRTYESCKRAVTVFHITNAVIITQNFHLPRALYLCKHLGMDTVEGLSADLHSYKDIVYFSARDVFASIKAWIDINALPPASPVKE